MGTIWYYIPSGNQTWHWDITYKWRFWWENHRTKSLITIVTGYIPATKMTPTAPASTRRCRVLRMGNKQCITQHRYLLGIGSIILLFEFGWYALSITQKCFKDLSTAFLTTDPDWNGHSQSIVGWQFANHSNTHLRIWVWKGFERSFSIMFPYLSTIFHQFVHHFPQFPIIFPTP